MFLLKHVAYKRLVVSEVTFGYCDSIALLGIYKHLISCVKIYRVPNFFL